MTNPAPDIPDQLRKLAELRDAGVLTQAEFDAKKAELLARDWSTKPGAVSAPTGVSTVAPSTGWAVPLTTAPPAAGSKKTSPVIGWLAILAFLAVGWLAWSTFTSKPGISGLPGGNLSGAGDTISATTGQLVTVNGVELTMLEAIYVTSLEYQTPPAGSIYVAYKFKVKAGSEQRFVGISNFAVAADGAQQGQAAFVVNPAWEPMLALDQVNPGNTLTGWIVFTVPSPSSYVQLTYTDNMFSGGTDAQWKLNCCE